MKIRTEDLFDKLRGAQIPLAARSDASTDRVLALTMEKIGGEHITRRKSLRFFALVAVISCLLLGTTVFASRAMGKYEEPMDLLGMAFGDEEFQSISGSEDHRSYYENEYTVKHPEIQQTPLNTEVAQTQTANVVSVNETLTDNGTTLKVISYFHDSVSGSGVIYYTLENPNGIRGYDLQKDGEIWWPGGEKVYISAHGKNYILPGDTNENRVSIAHYYTGMARRPENPTSIQVCFYANYRDPGASIFLDLGQFAAMGRWQSSGGSITVSPVGMILQLADFDFLWFEDEVTGKKYAPMDDVDIDTLVIRFQDGSEYVVCSNAGGKLVENSKYALIIPDPETKEKSISYVFNRLVDLEQIQQVEINGIPFQMAQE